MVPFGELSHNNNTKNYFKIISILLGLLINNSYQKNDLYPYSSGKPLKKCHADIFIDIIKIHCRQNIIREYEHLHILIQESRKKFIQNISHAILQE